MEISSLLGCLLFIPLILFLSLMFVSVLSGDYSDIPYMLGNLEHPNKKDK